MANLFSRLTAFLRGAFRKKKPFVEGEVAFHYPVHHDHDEEERVYFSDAFFQGDPYRENPSLAACSMGLAMASFGSNALKGGLSHQADNVVDFLTKAGFEAIETPPYFAQDTTTEGIAFAMGKKTIGKGKDRFTLIAVGVRGGNYGKEWSSNMKVGVGEEHDGFSIARDAIAAFFEDYLSRNVKKGKAKVWAAGYSRAAAVTNLFCASIKENYGKRVVTGVFGYAFACPSVTRLERLPAKSIHNYLNPCDLVPGIPLTAWGYRRYGEDIVLPMGQDVRVDVVKLELVRILNKQKRFKRTPCEDIPAFLKTVGEYFADKIPLEDFAARFQGPLYELLALVDPKEDNPYQALGDVLGGLVKQITDSYGPFSLLNMVASKRTDWNATLTPLIEKTLSETPYFLNATSFASAIAGFLYLIREDLFKKTDFFLTFFDGANLKAIFGQHNPKMYLDALKARSSLYEK